MVNCLSDLVVLSETRGPNTDEKDCSLWPLVVIRSSDHACMVCRELIKNQILNYDGPWSRWEGQHRIHPPIDSDLGMYSPPASKDVKCTTCMAVTHSAASLTSQDLFSFMSKMDGPLVVP